MATQSFDNAIRISKKSAKSFDTILNSDKKMTISNKPIAKDANINELRKFFGK